MNYLTQSVQTYKVNILDIRDHKVINSIIAYQLDFDGSSTSDIDDGVSIYFANGYNGDCHFDPAGEWVACGPLIEYFCVQLISINEEWMANCNDDDAEGIIDKDPKVASCLAIIRYLSNDKTTIELPSRLYDRHKKEYDERNSKDSHIIPV